MSSSPPSYFSVRVWRSLLKQASQHHDWIHSAAIAFALACSLLLGIIALLLLLSIRADLQAGLPVILWGNSRAIEPIQALLSYLSATWSWGQRCLGLGLSGVLGIGIWLKSVGFSQHLLRYGGRRSGVPRPSWRSRLITLLLGGANLALLLVAYGVVLMGLPGEKLAGAAPATALLMLRLLRWGVVFSTIALYFGMFFRSSVAVPFVQPVLPGTLLAAVLWLLPTLLLKGQVMALGQTPWLYALLSLALLSLGCLYQTALGLLLGGRFNSLLGQIWFGGRSPMPAQPVTPPSFDSFTIQRRPPR